MDEATKHQLKGEITKGLDALRTLRDEARVQIHLATMDAKERWNQLEPRLEEVERAAHEVTESSKMAVQQGVKQLKAFLDTLKR